jgi:hypothetical protein
LGRGQSDFNMASARCEMYARQVANQSINRAAISSLVMGSGYLAGAQLGASIAMRRNYDTCLQAAGWTPTTK